MARWHDLRRLAVRTLELLWRGLVAFADDLRFSWTGPHCSDSHWEAPDAKGEGGPGNHPVKERSGQERAR